MSVYEPTILVPAGGRTVPSKESPVMTRNAVIDAAVRVVARRADHQLRWPAIAAEAGNEKAMLASAWFQDMTTLVEECYARTAQAFSESLLYAETAPGTALDKVAAFLVSILELRRERGALLSFRRGCDLPNALQRRLHEWDQMVRARLKRLLARGRRDGSLALRNLDSACELILASLQIPDVAVNGPEQRMWDGELVELLLASLSEPHPPEAQSRKTIPVAEGACLCGAVRYALDGPFEILSHCQCSLCRKHRSEAAFVTVPLESFRWVAGAEIISEYRSPEHGTRAFCSHCGSVVPVAETETGLMFCPSGNLGNPLAISEESDGGPHPRSGLGTVRLGGYGIVARRL